MRAPGYYSTVFLTTWPVMLTVHMASNQGAHERTTDWAGEPGRSLVQLSWLSDLPSMPPELF